MLRLRQVALVASDRDRVVGLLGEVFDLAVGFHDPEITQLGLHNAVLPVGDQFIEVVSPTQPDTSAGRYLDRHGGDAGYMLIFQTSDHADHRQRVADAGVRVVARFDADGFTNMQLHPADTGGAFFEIDEQDGDDLWHPAGPEWQQAVRTELVTGIGSATVRCTDPRSVADRWAHLLDRPAVGHDDSRASVRVDDATVHFVDLDGGRRGIETVALTTVDVSAALDRAARTGVPHDDRSVTIGGVRFDLQPAG